MSEEIETVNDQLVGVKGEQIVIMLPKRWMSRDEAIRLAAWLVILADRDDSFPKVLKACKNA